MIREESELVLGENIYDMNTVFCILTDVKDKVLHLSENILTYFNIAEYRNSDVYIHNLIQNFDHSADENTG